MQWDHIFSLNITNGAELYNKCSHLSIFTLINGQWNLFSSFVDDKKTLNKNQMFYDQA